MTAGIGRRQQRPYLAPAFRPGLAGWLSALAAKTLRPDVSPRAGPLPRPASTLPPIVATARSLPSVLHSRAPGERLFLQPSPRGQLNRILSRRYYFLKGGIKALNKYNTMSLAPGSRFMRSGTM
jgi:hypothetical protein